MACPLQRLVRRCSIYICKDCGATPRQQILSLLRFTSRTGTLLKPVSAQEQHQHHPGVVRLLAAGILLVVPGLDLPQIPLSAHFQQKEHQVVLQVPVNRRGRQQAASARGFQGQEVLRMTYCIEQNRCSHYLPSGRIWQWLGLAWAQIYVRHALRSRPHARKTQPQSRYFQPACNRIVSACKGGNSKDSSKPSASMFS